MDYINGFIAAEKRKDIKPYLQKLFSNPDNITKELINDVLKNKRLDGAKEALQKIALSIFPEGKQSLILRNSLKTLKQKNSIIWGNNDNILPLTHSNDLPSNIEIHIIENAGHMVHIEQSTEVNKIINQTINHSKK